MAAPRACRSTTARPPKDRSTTTSSFAPATSSSFPKRLSMPYDALTPTGDDSVALRALQILRRRRLLAAVVFLTLLASAAGFAIYLPDLYQASALVLIERQVSEAVVRPSASGELET